MKQKNYFIIALLLIPIFALAGSGNKEDILKVLSDQEKAWNMGDIDGYMSGYWKSDSMTFIGKTVQYGWKNTCDNYKKSYPDKATMGTLKFADISIDILSANAAFVIGKWSLQREKGDVGGVFTLLFKKLNGQWVITCDHTS